jgi:hypothetical protein
MARQSRRKKFIRDFFRQLLQYFQTGPDKTGGKSLAGISCARNQDIESGDFIATRVLLFCHTLASSVTDQ